jgi:hypothetical protein
MQSPYADTNRNNIETYQCFKILHKISSPALVGSNPAQTDVTVWESLSVYLRKVGGLFLNALYNVSGFSLPPIITNVSASL